MKENKTRPTDSSIDSYLDSIENKNQRKNAQQLVQIMRKTTKAEPVLWGTSIVGFGKHHYMYDSGREGDTVAVGFAARKTALVIYGLFHFPENEENITLAQRLGPHTHGKGCLYIKSLDEIDLATLKLLIQNAYLARNGKS